MFLLRQGVNVRCHANVNVSVVKKTCHATILAVVVLLYVRFRWNRHKYISFYFLISVIGKSRVIEYSSSFKWSRKLGEPQSRVWRRIGRRPGELTSTLFSIFAKGFFLNYINSFQVTIKVRNSQIIQGKADFSKYKLVCFKKCFLLQQIHTYLFTCEVFSKILKLGKVGLKWVTLLYLSLSMLYQLQHANLRSLAAKGTQWTQWTQWGKCLVYIQKEHNEASVWCMSKILTPVKIC